MNHVRVKAARSTRNVASLKTNKKKETFTALPRMVQITEPVRFGVVAPQRALLLKGPITGVDLSQNHFSDDAKHG